MERKSVEKQTGNLSEATKWKKKCEGSNDCGAQPPLSPSTVQSVELLHLEHGPQEPDKHGSSAGAPVRHNQ